MFYSMFSYFFVGFFALVESVKYRNLLLLKKNYKFIVRS